MHKKIGELLIESGAVSQEQVRKALGQQRASGRRRKLGSVIITLGFASPSAVARALARQFDLPFVQLPEIPEQVRSLASLDFQAEHRIVLFRLERDGSVERLHVAVDDPSDLSVVDELSFQLQKPVRVHVAAEDDVDRALDLVRGLEVEPLAPEARPPSSPAVAVAALLGWELPSVPPPLDDDDDGDIMLITPRSALKPKPPAPPPPPSQESEEILDELLGESEPEAPKPPAAPDKKGSVPVVVFGGAAQGLPRPPPRPELPDISEEDLKVLEDIERMADGAEAMLHTEKVKPARMVASLIRLLIRKRVIHEEEFLEELSRK